MDWIAGIQQALEYIERHLTEEVDYDDVARVAFSSRYHFQRVFSILCGYTLGNISATAVSLWPVRNWPPKRSE